MANVKYGMNLRYASIWDLPLRALAAAQLGLLAARVAERWRGVGLAVPWRGCARSTWINITGWQCGIRSMNWCRWICCTRWISSIKRGNSTGVDLARCGSPGRATFHANVESCRGILSPSRINREWLGEPSPTLGRRSLRDRGGVVFAQGGARFDGLFEEVMYARQRLGTDENLVGKPVAREPEKELVAAQEQAAEPRGFYRQGEGGRDTARLDDLVAGLFEQLGQRGKGEEAAVGAVKDGRAGRS